MTHRRHPVGDDAPDALLYDECPECQMHVTARALNLTGAQFARAWNRMIDVEFRLESYRSRNEEALCRQLYVMGLLISRHGLGSDPWRRLDAEEDA